ncbi:hypothetical protein PT282_03825 [Bifidobacterium sp. ESL0763]|uniref:hypothetical protein n=1 Tax=Bifidobacterium sp. ESL0763 TaxID=2983227 RepID=UPI0023F8761D|nr:hypothetical protein [Bifidobacterium sp. ESL0763]MDF7663795.1 hypothetical protein [Bifidobacterium sp. ESL0763]
MAAIVPLVMWLFAMLWCLGICAICTINGAFRKRYDPDRPVRPVEWSVVAMQVVSVFTSCAPYGLYELLEGGMSAHIRAVYASLCIPSAVLMALAFAATLACMYQQARHADRDIKEQVLSGGRRQLP